MLVDGALAGHCLVVALYVVPALALVGLLLEVVPPWVWGGVILVTWAFATATMPVSATPLTTARLVQAGGSGLVVGGVCALPWLMLRLGLGSLPVREGALQRIFGVAMVMAFLGAGGLASLIEVVVVGARATMAPAANEVVRWCAAAILHGLWLGVSIATVGAVLAVALGMAAPSWDADIIGGVVTAGRVVMVVALAPVLARLLLQAIAEVFARLLALAG